MALHTVNTVGGTKPNGYSLQEAVTLVKQILGLLSKQHPGG